MSRGSGYGSNLYDLSEDPLKPPGGAKVYFTDRPKWWRPKLLCFLCIIPLVVVGSMVISAHSRQSSAWFGGFPNNDDNDDAGSSSTTTTSDDPSSPDDIDGGGWVVKRCVAASENTWHPATDQLAGTDVYGTYDETYTADPATFSIAWDCDDYSQVLLGLSDFSYWLIADEETIFTIGSPMNASIVQSNAAPNGPSYKALWYNRDGHGEDPWASVYDHWDDDPGMVYGGESKTGHLEHLGSDADGVGACVWLR